MRSGDDGFLPGSVQAEAAAAGGIEGGLLEAVGPGLFVVFGGEVGGAGAGGECLADALGVAFVAGAPWGGGSMLAGSLFQSMLTFVTMTRPMVRLAMPTMGVAVAMLVAARAAAATSVFRVLLI